MGKTAKTLIIVAGLILIAYLTIGIPYRFMKEISATTEKAIAPFADANKQLQTEVSELLNPTPTIIPDPITIIHEVRSLSRLETIQYSVEKVITAEIGQTKLGFLFGDRLLLVAHGVVIAGVDLGKISSSDLQIRDGALFIKIPDPEIFVATLDNDKSYVYDRETGLLTKGDVNLESEARKIAEEEIQKAALSDGILEQATVNAENYLARLLQCLGYQEVVFLKK